MLKFRLRQLGLRPLDVGGAGDCFFRAVSHQIYGDPNNHFSVRQAAIHYLRENPERFIESNTQNSWNDYLTNMSLQGSWCDALMVQAVAESQNLKIHIVESHENFADTTVIEPVHLSQQPRRTIYLGHVNEVHYVSTVPCTCSSDSSESHQSHLNVTEQNVLSEQSRNNSLKRKRASYMREYRKRKKVDQTNAKSKHNGYMTEYRKQKADESKKRTFIENNPSLECEIETQSVISKSQCLPFSLVDS